MTRQEFKGTIAVLFVLAFIFALTLLFGSFKVIDPGKRGVRVTLGSVDRQFVAEGVAMKLPWLTTIHETSVRQRSWPVDAACYSSDLQQVNCKLKVMYRIPEGQVVALYKDYQSDEESLFNALISPRVQEALKEATAGSTAEQIVKKREVLKKAALVSAQGKIGQLVLLDDLVIENIDLTKELETAIEQKMVQEQNANKAKYEQDRRRVEADTKVIEAKAEAEAIRIQGEALKQTPDLIQLRIVEKWDGHTPQVVGASTQPTGIILPMSNRK